MVEVTEQRAHLSGQQQGIERVSLHACISRVRDERSKVGRYVAGLLLRNPPGRNDVC
jgi:hypothetical protein